MNINGYEPKNRNILTGANTLSKMDIFYQDIKHQYSLGNKLLLVCDEITKEKAGDTIVGELQDVCEIYTICIDDADFENVEMVKKEISEKEIDLVFGVGGGRPIDVAKLASFQTGKYWISVPTAISHDGIISDRASIHYNGTKSSILGQPPIGLVVDLKIIEEAPKRNLSAGYADIFSNLTAVEDAYLSARINGEEINEEALFNSYVAAAEIIDLINPSKKYKEEGLGQLARAAVKSGKAMQRAGSSRPASGCEHAISHCLEEIVKKPAMHGENCGIASIFTMRLHDMYNNEKRNKEDYSSIAIANRKFEAPTLLEEIGVTLDEFTEAVLKAPTIRDRYGILDYVADTVGLTPELIHKTAYECGIGRKVA